MTCCFLALVLAVGPQPPGPRQKHVADIVRNRLDQHYQKRRRESEELLGALSQALEANAPCVLWPEEVPTRYPEWAHRFSALHWAVPEETDLPVLLCRDEHWIWCSYGESPTIIFDLRDGKQLFLILIRDDAELVAVRERLKQGRPFSRVGVGPKPRHVAIPHGALGSGEAPYLSERGLSGTENSFPCDAPRHQGEGLLVNRFIWLWGNSVRHLQAVGYCHR